MEATFCTKLNNYKGHFYFNIDLRNIQSPGSFFTARCKTPQKMLSFALRFRGLPSGPVRNCTRPTFAPTGQQVE